MFQWLRDLFDFKQPSLEEGRKFAIESLESGRYTRDQLNDYSMIDGFDSSDFDKGIRQVLQDTKE